MSRLHVERTRHWRECPECSGDGFVTANNSHMGDPQCERDEDCPNRDCYEGEIELWADPLVLMRQARSHRFHPSYRKARERAMRKEPEFVGYYFGESGIRFMATARELGYWKQEAA